MQAHRERVACRVFIELGPQQRGKVRARDGFAPRCQRENQFRLTTGEMHFAAARAHDTAGELDVDWRRFLQARPREAIDEGR